MSYKLNIIHDNPIGFWMLDEVSGSTVYDSSSYQNNGSYNGTINFDELPIVSDSMNATKIDSSISIDYSSFTSFGTKETSDNDFSLECWFKPSVLTNSKVSIFGDSVSNVGLFWQYQKIIFSVQNQEISYLLPNSNKAVHIVAVYSVNSIYLYVDGNLVAYKTIPKTFFLNTQNTFQSGPITNISDSFLIDCPAIYRYSLNLNQIKNHYISAQTIPAIQIVYPDQGQLFKIYDDGVSREHQYVYPANKSWKYLANNNLFYNEYDETLSLAAVAGTNIVSVEELITIPLGFDLNSSKIEWNATQGVEVYASTDNSVFLKCQNGFPIPKYKYGTDNFYPSRKIYLSIRFKTSDVSKYLPKIYDLMLSFYNNKKIYASNGGAVISHIENPSKNSSISFSNYYSPVLLRDFKNGLNCSEGSGFNLKTISSVQSIEFFYTPLSVNMYSAEITDIAATINSILDSIITTNPASESMLNSAVESIPGQKISLIYNEASGTELSYVPGQGLILDNIDKIYVNGEDVTNWQSSNSLFKPNKLHHILITLSAPISGDINFNHADLGSSQATYQNIAIYPSQFSQTKALDHFNMWTGKYKVTASDSSFTITENSVSTYDNDWVVLQTTQ